MANKEKIKKEIERRIEICEKYSQLNLTTSTRNGNHAQLLELREIKDFIDSLPEEEPSVKGLTWKDVNTLDTLIDQVRHEFPNGISEKSFGLAVLEKFQDYHDDAEEPVSEDLEEEINNYFKDWTFDDEMSVMAKPNHYFAEFNDIKEIARHFAKWQKQKDQETIELAEDHAMLAGMNKMKEEMMKNAVEAEVFIDYNINFGYGSLTANIDLDEQHLKEGDKVKIIIVKTEQQ